LQELLKSRFSISRDLNFMLSLSVPFIFDKDEMQSKSSFNFKTTSDNFLQVGLNTSIIPIIIAVYYKQRGKYLRFFYGLVIYGTMI
jgi:hypothetical protein